MAILDKKSVHGKVFEFISRTVSTDPTRYFMNYIYFDHEERALVSTDGRREAILTLGDGAVDFLGDIGFPSDKSYSIAYARGAVEIIPEEKAGQFPNWKRVTPDESSLNRVKTLGQKDYDADFSTKISMKMHVGKTCVLTGAIIDYTFLTDLFGFSYSVKVDKVSPEKKAVVFETTFDYGFPLKVLIMPMQLD